MNLVQGQTALHLAATCIESDVAKLLLARGADINAKDRNVSQHWGLLSLTDLKVYNASVEPCLMYQGFRHVVLFVTKAAIRSHVQEVSLLIVWCTMCDNQAA